MFVLRVPLLRHLQFSNRNLISNIRTNTHAPVSFEHIWGGAPKLHCYRATK